MYNNINFNNKTILITGGAGFIGSNLAFYFQENFPNSKVIVFDCFRNNEIFPNGNLKSFGHYKNLIGFKGDIICGNINNQADLELLDDRLGRRNLQQPLKILQNLFLSGSPDLLEDLLFHYSSTLLNKQLQ